LRQQPECKSTFLFQSPPIKENSCEHS
jgi:hypothetical protein